MESAATAAPGPSGTDVTSPAQAGGIPGEPQVVIDLAGLADRLSLSITGVEAAIRLIDDGNTVPFIARYRKDQTGGLDEVQIRRVVEAIGRARQLAERKRTVLRTIAGQGRLAPEITRDILAAESLKRLEDLYLPFKPRKLSLAEMARQRRLEPFASEIVSADPAAADLDRRAADFISEDAGVATAADALLGVGHILAESFAERADLRQRVRAILHRQGHLRSTRCENEPKVLSAKAVEVRPAPAARTAPTGQARGAGAAEAAIAEPPAESRADEPTKSDTSALPAVELTASPATDDAAVAGGGEAAPPVEVSPMDAANAPSASEPTGPQPSADRKNKKKNKKAGREAKQYRDYFDFSDHVQRIPPHRALAINRGERAKVLKVRIDVPLEEVQAAAEEVVLTDAHPHRPFLAGCLKDAVARLILPSLERELRREITDYCESHAVNVFARNLRNLLLQPPVVGRRVLALDPGFKSGCKAAVLDECGNPLEHAVLHIIGQPEKRTAAASRIVELVRTHGCTVIAVGNGTAGRETETLVAELVTGELADVDVGYAIVNEAGASVYSTSAFGREELPAHEAAVRGAISIGRRLQDPLSELVKIEPANIGVGLYQHDVKARHLHASLDSVVESCVNYVGVDVNTASPALLRYVSGLNQATARNLFEWRTKNGPFTSRQQFLEVPGFGEAAFVQSVGFLKIVGGSNPLDSTWIHPESYAIAEKVLERLGATPADLATRQQAEGLASRAATVDLRALAAELGVGRLLLADILEQLARPGRDPREDLPRPFFKKGVLKLEDLEVGMELSGSVLNVVDFGAFVDIGLHDSGLVHISQLSSRYVRDPHDVVSVGQIVKVWVLELDKARRRVALTMISPAERQRQQEAKERSREAKARRREEAGQRRAAPKPAAAPAAADPPAAPRPARPPRGREERRGGPPREPRTRTYEVKPKQPAAPITKAMQEGKEPLRTFGDLKQFLETRSAEKPDAEGDGSAG